MTRAAAALGVGPRRLAVIGSGITGLLAARLLSTRHDVTLFEQDNRIGGHTHTVEVEIEGNKHAIDTGFIVFNERNYPNFTAMLGALGVAHRPSTMSFSLQCERTGLEYCGSSPSRLFVQRRNLLRPSFYGMLLDIVRFHRHAGELLATAGDQSLAEVLLFGGYGDRFVDHYLVPVTAAIWSTEPRALLEMPARFVLQFLQNHGMLQVRGRPQWRTVVGGSHRYLAPLVAPLQGRIRTGAPVTELRRTVNGVRIVTNGEGALEFDAAVVATHSDQALALLGDATADERAVLGAIRYQDNDVVLHTDERLLPRRRRAWAAWNYHFPRVAEPRVAVTYLMNQLQGLAPDAPTFCVTLNRTAAIDPAKVLRRFLYHHPLFDRAAVRAQRLVPTISGQHRVWYCGAWCGYGFHEDGVAAALGVAADFGLSLRDLAPRAAVVSA